MVTFPSARAQVAGEAGPEVQPGHVLARPKRTVPEVAHACAYVRSQHQSPQSSYSSVDRHVASFSRDAACACSPCTACLIGYARTSGLWLWL